MKKLLCSVWILSLIVAAVGCKDAGTEAPQQEGVKAEFDKDRPVYPVNIDVTAGSATVSGSVDIAAGSCVEAHGIVWSTTNPNPTLADNKADLGKSCGPFPLEFNASISPVTSGSTIYVRQFANSSGGVVYSDAQQLKPGGAAPKFPNITGIPEIPVAGKTEYTISSFIEAQGDSPIVEHGFVYTDNVFTTQGATLSDKVLKLGPYTGTFHGKFSGTITGLKPNTLYTLRAFAINASGVSYGRPWGFTTLE